jgi:ATP synthase A1 C subunit
MSASQYAFINARIGAMKSYLLDVGELKAVAEATNFDDSLALLKNTAYGGVLVKLSSPSLTDIESVFTKGLVHDYEKIIRSMHGIAKVFLEQHARKFEIASIKTLIMMKIGGEETKEYPWVPYKTMTGAMIERLLQVATPEELIEMLKFTEYYPVLHKVFSEYKEGDTAFPFIAALDRYVYGKLGKLMDEMHGKDREMARRLIGVEIDAKNLITLLRLRGSDEHSAWSCLIPYRYKLKDEDLRMVFNIHSLSELPSQLPKSRYSDIILQGIRDYEKTGTFFQLELNFRRYILTLNTHVFYGDRFHIGIPIAYLNLKENEIRNLVAVLKAKEAGLASSEIEGLLVLPA